MAELDPRIFSEDEIKAVTGQHSAEYRTRVLVRWHFALLALNVMFTAALLWAGIDAYSRLEYQHVRLGEWVSQTCAQ